MKEFTRPLTILIYFIQLNFLHAQTFVPGGSVSGFWSVANSPYIIQGSIMIPNGQTLNIQAGTSLIFQGSHQLFVQGRLLAEGGVNDSITFTAADTTYGWRGIRFDNTAMTNDTSRISYCRILYGRNLSYQSNGNGGGMYVNNFSKIIVKNSSFRGCKSSCSQCNGNNGNGAGLYTNVNIKIQHCTFISNAAMAQGSGGGLFASAAGQEIKNCVFAYNKAHKHGGLLLSGNGTKTTNCSIVYNFSEMESGGIGINGSGSSVNYSNISNNRSGKFGGGIYLTDGAQVNHCSVQNNVSLSGGGIYGQGNVKLIANTIKNNDAQDTFEPTAPEIAGGGGVYLTSVGAQLQFNNIEQNRSNGFGGAIFCKTNGVIIDNNTIVGNFALEGGGGLFFRLEVNSPTSVNGNVISNNYGEQGGAVFLNNDVSYIDFINNTIANNLAQNGGALFAKTNNNPYIANCILYGNMAAQNGNQVFLTDQDSQPEFDHCIIQGGSTDFFTNGNFYIGYYTNVMDVDPLFINPANGVGPFNYQPNVDWRLLTNSVCIDGGTDALNLTLLDLDSTVRKSGSMVDAGAYERISACQSSITPNFSIGNTACLNAPSTPLSALSGNNILGTWSPANIVTSQLGPQAYAFTPYAGQCATNMSYTITVNVSPTAQLTQINPIAACFGSGAQISCNSLPNATYQWFANGNPVAGATTNAIFPEISGSYIVAVTQNNCQTFSAPLNATIFPLPATPIVQSSGIFAPCQNTSLVLTTPIIGNLSYEWNTNATGNTLVVNSPGMYSVSVTDANGCESTSSPYSVTPINEQSPSICLVSNDSLTTMNRIVWEKPINDRIDSFYVYKETTVANIFQKIGSKAYNDTAYFIDINSNPMVQAYRYKLSILDTCGGESELSDYHQTMHLTINQGVGQSYNLIWSHYQGFIFGSYTIYRGTSPTNLDSLTTIQSNLNSYTDLNAPTGPIYYQIEVVNPNGCDPFKQTDYGVTRSNISNNGMSEIEALIESNQAFISPNPNDGITTLLTPPSMVGNKFVLTDGFGRTLLSSYVESTDHTLNLDYVSSGTYYLSLEGQASPIRIIKR
jgi:predicted outer membrane repeat protein